jgi:hypothetical protein
VRRESKVEIADSIAIKGLCLRLHPVVYIHFGRSCKKRKERSLLFEFQFMHNGLSASRCSCNNLISFRRDLMKVRNKYKRAIGQWIYRIISFSQSSDRVNEDSKPGRKECA